MMTMKFYKDKQDKHRCRITAGNGEIIFSSHQGFSSRQACLANVELVAKAVRECNSGGG